MKKIILTILLTSLALFTLVTPLVVSAKDGFVEGLDIQLKATAGEQGADFGEVRDPRKIVTDTIQVALSVLGIVFLVVIIYAGFTWLMSSGDEEKIKTAQRTLKYAIIGFVIVMTSYSITIFVKRYLDLAGSPYGPGGSGYWQAEWGVQKDVSDFYPNQDPYGGSAFGDNAGIWGSGQAGSE